MSAADGCVELGLLDGRWLSLASACPAATPFHHPAWAQLVADTYGYHAFAFAVPDHEGELVAGVPFVSVRDPRLRRRWVSLPFTDACEPLARDEGGLGDLLRGLSAHAGPPVEIRAGVGELGWHTHAGAVQHVLELDGPAEEVAKRFSRSNVVRNIKRAERSGVSIRTASSPADLDAFWTLHVQTRHRQGVPVQPRRFFDLIWDRMIVPGLGSILLADVEGATVAAALFLSWNGTTVYKFGASDAAAWGARPNHLLFWTAVREACARQDRRFDFGRTDTDNAGLRAFKSGWGGREQPLVYSRLPANAARNAESIPGRVLGATLRRGPASLCRLVGQATYRYAAAR